MVLTAVWRGLVAGQRTGIASTVRPLQMTFATFPQRGYAQAKEKVTQSSGKTPSMKRSVTPMTLYMVDMFSDHARKRAENPDLPALTFKDIMPGFKGLDDKSKLELRARQHFIFDWFTSQGIEYAKELRAEADNAFFALGPADRKKWLEVGKVEEERLAKRK